MPFNPTKPDSGTLQYLTYGRECQAGKCEELGVLGMENAVYTTTRLDKK